MRTAVSLLFLLFLPAVCANGQSPKTQNVFLITLDGLRWQELFTGADSSLMRDERFTRDEDAIVERFWADEPSERRRLLMPFFWTVIATEGQLYGNRHLGSRVDVTNGLYFSYPGYNEILVGYADDSINSNDKRPNPNRTVLEVVNEQPGFEGRVAAFGSWDVFPYIVNEERSGIPVNAGFRAAQGDDLSDRERFLNELQGQIPSPWSSVRLDAFTHHYALEYIRKHRPRLVYIAYGETDDFAHDGRFDAYLNSAYQTNQFIKSLWDWAQSDEDYRAKTTFVITTDHGRGDAERWTSHGRDIPGAEQIWIAFLGPDTPPLGEIRGSNPNYQNQVAATVAALLGLDYQVDRPTGAVIQRAIGRVE